MFARFFSERFSLRMKGGWAPLLDTLLVCKHKFSSNVFHLEATEKCHAASVLSRLTLIYPHNHPHRSSVWEPEERADLFLPESPWLGQQRERDIDSQQIEIIQSLFVSEMTWSGLWTSGLLLLTVNLKVKPVQFQRIYGVCRGKRGSTICCFLFEGRKKKYHFWFYFINTLQLFINYL